MTHNVSNLLADMKTRIEALTPTTRQERKNFRHSEMGLVHEPDNTHADRKFQLVTMGMGRIERIHEGSPSQLWWDMQIAIVVKYTTRNDFARTEKRLVEDAADIDTALYPPSTYPTGCHYRFLTGIHVDRSEQEVWEATFIFDCQIRNASS